SSSSPSSSRPAPNAQLFLLTHVHSDHLLGLSDGFTGKIICSADTKRMLLALEPEKERVHLEDGIREEKRLKYAGLARKNAVDRIVGLLMREYGFAAADSLVQEAIPYGHPTVFELGYGEKVTITLLDAGHCPGSTMFLITSPDKAVLHTGDIRADSLFLQSLRRQPSLQEFIVPWDSYHSQSTLGGGRRCLDRIYLDTSAVVGTGDMPDKETALQGLLQQMSLYPSDTIFFLNVWCFGWEEVVKEVARYFGERVHVDRYKRRIYSAIQSDPFLMSCTTGDEVSTRFHACERKAKCKSCRLFNKQGERVYNADKRIVQVEMVEIKAADYDQRHQSFLEQLGRAACGDGPYPWRIECPFARHSPLPELQALVKLFRPRSISPNCIVIPLQFQFPLPPELKDCYRYLPALFKDCVAEGSHEIMLAERDAYFIEKYGLESLKTLADVSSDTPIDLGMGLPTILTGRKAMAADHMSRLFSTPFGGELDVKPVQSGNSTRHTLDYDTDDDSPRGKRRRRDRSPGAAVSPVRIENKIGKNELGLVDVSGVEAIVKHEQRATRPMGGKGELRRGDIEVKKEEQDRIVGEEERGHYGSTKSTTTVVASVVEVTETGTPAVKQEDEKPVIRRKPSRFVVNSQHLRMLAMVDSDDM
ncbi:hypothetical protein P7C73_g1215, partial [Tremellales sp. Uapishka_1]